MSNDGTQLTLVDTGDRSPWRIDEQTRDTGRRGIAEARRMLRDSARHAAA